MIFYQGLLESKIWSEKQQKIVVDFSPNGVFETDDEEIIELLNKMEYPTQADRLEWEKTGRYPRRGGFHRLGEKPNLPSGRPAIEDYEPGKQTPVRAANAPSMPATEKAELASTLPPTPAADKVVKRKKATTAKKKTSSKKVPVTTKPKKKIARRSKTNK